MKRTNPAIKVSAQPAADYRKYDFWKSRCGARNLGRYRSENSGRWRGIFCDFGWKLRITGNNDFEHRDSWNVVTLKASPHICVWLRSSAPHSRNRLRREDALATSMALVRFRPGCTYFRFFMHHSFIEDSTYRIFQCIRHTFFSNIFGGASYMYILFPSW